jgi:hypothetical protein
MTNQKRKDLGLALFFVGWAGIPALAFLTTDWTRVHEAATYILGICGFIGFLLYAFAWWKQR